VVVGKYYFLGWTIWAGDQRGKGKNVKLARRRIVRRKEGVKKMRRR